MNDYQTKRRFRQRKLNRQGFYERRQQLSRARRAALSAAPTAMPSMAHIFHTENLIRVFDELKRYAGHAAGLDGVHYNQLGQREVCQIMRELSRVVLSGVYEPSRARHVKIPKANGQGNRTLKLRSIVDRVVAKAITDALTPSIDHLFLDGSHGFRPSRGPWSMFCT